MNLLRFLIRTSRWTVLLAIAAGSLGGVCGVALIALIHRELGQPVPSGWVVGTSFAGLCLLSGVARVLAQVAMVRLGQKSVAELGLLLCRTILGLTPEQFETIDSSSLLTVLTEDIVIVAGALVGIPLVSINLPIVLICLAYTGWLSVAVLACSVVAVVLGIVVYLMLASRAMRRLRAARAEQDELVGGFRALLEGFRELKLHRARRRALLEEVLEPSAVTVRDHTTAGLSLYALSQGWSQLAFFGFLGFLLFVLPTIQTVDRSTLAGVVLVVLFLMTPLDVLLTWIPILGRAMTSMQKIQTLLPDLASRSHGEVEPTRLITFHESLRLEGVTYDYRRDPDGDGFLLGPIHLELRPGELIFVAGGNGSGKTTLVKLLSGLYGPQGGQISLDGQPVTDADRDAYRQLFTIVFADGYLFRRLLGLDHVDLELAAQAGLCRLELDGKVRVENRRYSTTDLSQGQRRRLALLTACLEDRPILILDEWAANQDQHFKRIFYREFLPEWKAQGKTVVVISHDEDYYDQADRIVRLHEGQLVEVDGEPLVIGQSCLITSRSVAEETI